MLLFINFEDLTARGQIINCPCSVTLWDKNKDLQSETNHIFSFYGIFFMIGFTVGEHVLIVQDRKKRKIITTIFLIVL